MTKQYDILILVLGWEERFLLGLQKDLELYDITKIILLNFHVYESNTEDNKLKINKICKEKSIELNEVKLNYQDSIKSWKILSDCLAKISSDNQILLDITTTPRETIWSTIYHLRGSKKNLDFIYHKPEKYHKDWLTKEPAKPRLLLKHSGIHKLNYPTALLVITGFEYERAKQLIYFFEPKLTLIGVQQGDQFNNLTRNEELRKSLKEFSNINEFEIDAYSSDFGFKILKDKISNIGEKYNVVLASLGPKLTSISTYNIILQNPEIALAYVPTKEFNLKYSLGIGEYLSGSVYFKE